MPHITQFIYPAYGCHKTINACILLFSVFQTSGYSPAWLPVVLSSSFGNVTAVAGHRSIHSRKQQAKTPACVLRKSHLLILPSAIDAHVDINNITCTGCDRQPNWFKNQPESKKKVKSIKLKAPAKISIWAL